MYRKAFIVFIASNGTVTAAEKTPAKQAKKAPADIVASINADTGVRQVQFDPKDMPLIHTRVKYTTVIALPKTEKIVDFLSGDVDNWVINGADNFCYLKPAKKDLRTNLNLVTASGNVYSFLMVEDSATPPDLKVFVDTHDADMIAALGARPRWIRAEEVEAVQKEVEKAHAETEEARRGIASAKSQAEAEATERVEKIRSTFPGTLRYDYEFKDRRSTFGVRAIAHDERRTYIWSNAQETPALYEVKDSKPNLITFDFHNGVYIVDKIVNDGYLAVGKHKMGFKRGE